MMIEHVCELPVFSVLSYDFCLAKSSKSGAKSTKMMKTGLLEVTEQGP
jgi:hypothetical protein